MWYAVVCKCYLRQVCPCLVCLTLWAVAVCWLLQAMRMWASLQGVGISVKADTALPSPLLLLHKTSQPAQSPGLESVSPVTCQNQEITSTFPSRLPPCVDTHPALSVCCRSLPSLLMSYACMTSWDTTRCCLSFLSSAAHHIKLFSSIHDLY